MTTDEPAVPAIGFDRVSLLTVVITVALCLGLYFYGQEQVRLKVAAAMAETDTLAQRQAVFLCANVSRVVQTIDTIHGLAQLADNALQAERPKLATEAFKQLAAWKDDMHDGIVQVAVIAPSGYMTLSNMAAPAVPVYLGDRAHFLAIARDKKSSYVSTPMVGRVSGRTTLQFAAGSFGPDGMLQSVSVVSVDPSLFATLARELGINGTDTVTILRDDGALLASTADNAAAVASQLPLALGLPSQNARLGRRGVTPSATTPLFASGQIAGVWRDRKPIDGITRSYAWRAANHNLQVVVGLDIGKQLADAQPTIVRINRLAWTAVGFVTLCGLVFLRYRQLRLTTVAAFARTNAIQEKGRWLKTMADGLPYMVRLLDRNGIAVYANPTVKSMLGYDPVDVVGNPLQKFVYPDDRDSFYATKLSALKDGEQGSARFRAVHADGSIVMLHSIVRRIASADAEPGEPVFIATSRDTTHEDKSEADLRAAKQELEDVMAATPGFFFRTERLDENAVNFVFVSNGVERVLGFIPQEVMESGFLERHTDPLAAPSLREYRRKLAEEGTASIHYRIRHKSGHWIWLSVVTRAIVEGNNRTRFGYAYDITKERSQNLHIAQVEKLAMLGEMTTGIAHELNQPLAGISMIAENALALVDDSTARGRFLEQKLQRIVDQVARAASIINHMRVFGRKIDDSITEFSADFAVRGALSIMQGKTQFLEIECGLAADLPSLSGSIVLIEQVLINLIGNAIDQIESHIPPLPSDRRWIRLTTASEQGMISIEILDAAGGVDPANIDRIFEPFFTTKAVGKGTGLGLSIGYGIIKDMGGILSVRNQGHGACFRVELPAVVADVSPAQS
jgi:PAS domain S-box-containing protein